MARNLNDYKGKGDGQKREMEAPVLEPGGYPARLVGVVFLGVQKQQPFKGEAKDPAEMVQYTYELSHEFMVDKEGNPIEDKPRWFSERMPVFGPKAERAKLTLRNRALDPSGSFGGDPSKLLGKACNVLIVHRPNKKDPKADPYQNIGDVTAAAKMKGYVQPDLVNPPVYFDPQDESCTVEQFRALPEYLQKIIKGADDFYSSPLADALGQAKDAPQEDQGQEQAPQEDDQEDNDADNNPF